MKDYPILEFDPSREAIIDPSAVHEPHDQMPSRCVLPIYHTVIEALEQQGRLQHVTDIHTVMGPMPVRRMTHEGQDFAVVHPGLCAPFAAAMLEELIALGGREFIACGAAGVLDPSLPKGTVVVPTAAVRDEGTSYHYVEPAREISASPDVVSIIEGVLQEHGVPYQRGKTWTTDAIYRETPQRIAARRAEGCLTVEMECAAFLAVAAFRGVRFGQMFVTADDVSGTDWDPRGFMDERSFPEHVFWWSVEACAKL